MEKETEPGGEMNARLAVTGSKIGKLEIKSSENLIEELEVKFFKNGRSFYRILADENSRLVKETDISGRRYLRKEELVDYAQKMATGVYGVPWWNLTAKYAFSFQIPKVEVNYKSVKHRRNLGVAGLNGTISEAA